MQTESGDEVHVIDPGFGRKVKDRLDDPLTGIGPLHRRQRQRDVIERDGQLHAGRQQRRQRVIIDRVEQRLADRAVRVLQTVERLARIDHPAPTDRQLLHAEALAVVEKDGWRLTVHFEHKARSWVRDRFLLHSSASIIADSLLSTLTEHGKGAERKELVRAPASFRPVFNQPTPLDRH